MKLIDLGLMLVGGAASLTTSTAWSFENTKVLPSGVRSLNVRTVNTTIDYKSDGTGHFEPLAKPLSKDLLFEKVVAAEEGVKQTQLKAFLANEGFALDEPIGSFSAEMQGKLAVVAPIFSYGLSEHFTLALALPYYQARMGVEAAFVPSPEANRFIARLHDPAYNLTQSAREAAEKVNDAIGELNKKLSENGFRQLADWDGRGLGDATLAGKFLLVDAAPLKIATTTGVVLPTGRVDDPDVLNDVPFGKGTYDVFALLIADQPLGHGVFLNQYGRYTYSFLSRRKLRMATADESIEVGKAMADYKIGDRWEVGASLQFEPAWGLVTGLGYVFSRKMGDRYNISSAVAHAVAVQDKLQSETDGQAHYLESKFGYSAVPAFRRGELALPFAATLEYKRHLASTHTFTNDFVSIDLAVYF